MPDVHVLQTIYNERIFSQFLIADEKLLLVDSGMHGWVERYIEPQVQALGYTMEQLDYLVTSHADVDHYGGNAGIRAASPRAAIVAHKLDTPWIEQFDAILSERFGLYDRFGQGYDSDTKEWLRNAAGPPTPVDIQISGGETIRLGPNRELKLIHAPGHSPGLLIVWDARTETLITNDAILGRGMRSKDGILEGPPPYFMLPDYTNSLQMMLGIGFERLLHTHLPEMNREQGIEYINETIEHVYEVEAFIALKALQTSPQTMSEICGQVVSQFGPYPVMPSEIIASVAAHLQQLVRTGRAKVETSSSTIRWYR